ncbi:hypothetical protein Q3H58_003170 [Pseudomonas psychrotolerans]|nr:hypothetical protein [Pseudomonas psychrotolerans]
MLSHDQRAIIKATIPLLETGGEDLTRHFYDKLATAARQQSPATPPVQRCPSGQWCPGSGLGAGGSAVCPAH